MTSDVHESSLTSCNAQTYLILCAFFLSVYLSLLVAVEHWKGRHFKLPPGPWGMPILGVIPFMGKKRHVTVQQWWDKYGDVFSAKMGSRRVVVINGIDAMKECFLRQPDTFSGRPMNYFKKLTRNTGKNNILY